MSEHIPSAPDSIAPPPQLGPPVVGSLPSSSPPVIIKKRLPGVIIAVAVIAVLWISAGFYLLLKELTATRDRLDAEVTQAAAARQETARLAARLEQAESRLGDVVTSDLEDLHDQQRDIEAMLENLRDKVERNPQIWITAESAYLLRIANERLHLDGDLAAALAALEAADQRLQSFNDPSLFEVRRALTAEITALRAVPIPDVTGIGLRLGALADGVERLPFPHAPGTVVDASASDAGAAADGWRKVAHDAWQELRKLVVIKHKDRSDQPLMTPDERQVLQQNLRLSLETAQVALLRRNDALFHDSLRRVQAWMERYFDRDTPAVQHALQDVVRMQEVKLAPPLPDLSASLRALDDWQAQRRNKARGGEGEAAP